MVVALPRSGGPGTSRRSGQTTRRTFLRYTALAGAAVSPLAARGQQRAAMPVIGFLSPLSPGPQMATRIGAFGKGLAEQNYVDGQNVAIEYRWAEGQYDRLPALAAELVRRQVAVIAALTQDAALAAKAATATVPIVFNVGWDPAKSGLVDSLSRPGGNATGISMFSYEVDAKRLSLLHELVPRARAVGLLVNPNNAGAEEQIREVERAAGAFGLSVHVSRAGTERDLEGGVESLVRAGAQAMLAAADPFLSLQRERLVVLAARHRLPAVWEWPDFVADGGLMSYGTDIVDNYRQAGAYTGRVLHGEKPSELPVVRPVKFVLAINLKAARALEIEVPAALIARADDVIE